MSGVTMPDIGAGHPVLRALITEAGGTLPIWAVLHEDLYETRFGDGRYFHIRGAALDAEAAARLAGLAPPHPLSAWHVRKLRLGLDDGRPVLLEAQRGDEFTVEDIALIMSEIGPGESASRLLLGPGRRSDGPLVGLDR